jgi:hypothetical protein
LEKKEKREKYIPLTGREQSLFDKFWSYELKFSVYGILKTN